LILNRGRCRWRLCTTRICQHTNDTEHRHRESVFHLYQPTIHIRFAATYHNNATKSRIHDYPRWILRDRDNARNAAFAIGFCYIIPLANVGTNVSIDNLASS
jgi:hypothetical protein